MPDDPLVPAGRPADADLDAAITKAETYCATCFRALAAATGERDARLLRGLLALEREELAGLRVRRARLRAGR